MRPEVLIRQLQNPVLEFGRDATGIGFDIVGRVVLPSRRDMHHVTLIGHLGDTHANLGARKLG